MRLLVFTETYPPDRGGMSESCDRILRGLARERVALDVVHFDRRASRFEKRTTSSGTLLRVPPEADAAHVLNLVWNVLEREVDPHSLTHVLAFGGHLPLLGAPVFASWLRKPLVTLLRGNDLDTGMFDPRRRAVLDDAVKRSAAVCTVTKSHAQKIALLHDDVPVHVIANGIDFELWEATDADAVRAKAIAADAEGKRILGLFGHLKNKKGVPFFVDALRQSAVADEFHLLLCGEIESAVEGVSHTLVPVMDRYALIPFYLASDLVVVPSHYDGFPNVLVEAMALARPLLASTAGGMRDVLADGENAFLFAPGDAMGCRDAIQRAARADAEELRRMGAAAESVARRCCDVRLETSRYLEVLHLTEESSDAKKNADRDAGPRPRELSWREWRR